MESNLFRYILKHSRGEQLKILFTVLVAMLFYYLSLNLPKSIVNEAIQGKRFPTPDATVTVLKLNLTLPDFVGGATWHLFDGLTLERIPDLLLLSFAFLALVVINNGFKFHINTTKGRLGERIAVVGAEAGGKHEFAQLLGGLLRPTGGSLTVARLDVGKASEVLVGTRLAYVGPDCYLFPRSLYDNIVFGLLHIATRESHGTDEPAHKRRWRLEEARRTGNVAYDARADWIDYEAAGVAGPDGLGERIVEVLAAVELEQDVYALGLRGIVDAARHPALAAGILSARSAVAERLQPPQNKDLVDRFDMEAYNRHASVAENLLFGVPVGKLFGLESLAENPYMRAVLDKVQLTEPLVAIGLASAQTLVELFADMAADNELFRRYSVIDFDDLPIYKTIVARAAAGAVALSETDRARLISLAFRLLPGQRLADLNAELQAKIVQARKVFRQDLPASMHASVDFFEIGRYAASASLLDNILFGRIDQGRADASGRVPVLVSEIVADIGLRGAIVRAGLDFNAGSGGGRLSSSQRQKLALARALLKRPDLLVIDDALAPLDAASRARITETVLIRAAPGGVVWVLQGGEAEGPFDRVLVIEDGRVREQRQLRDPRREDEPRQGLRQAS